MTAESVDVDDVEGTVDVGEDGWFELPDKYQDADKVVVRTPALTVDVKVGGKVDGFWFEDDGGSSNPELSPDRVVLKEYGEDPEVYRVEGGKQ